MSARVQYKPDRTAVCAQFLKIEDRQGSPLLFSLTMPMIELCRAGEIRTIIQMVEGFEQTPTALRDMLLGKYTGKVLVRYANAAPSISGTTP